MILVNRFEGEYAVCEENGSIINVDVRLFGENVCEGDAVVMSTRGVYETDEGLTNALKDKVRTLSERLFEE